MNIKEISKQINENAHAKGFWDKGVDVPKMLALIHSEVSEALEADRIDSFMEYSIKTINEAGDSAFDSDFRHYVKDTFEDELADAAIRIFDLAYEMKIDLCAHIEAKVRFNASRPIMHGGKKY